MLDGRPEEAGSISRVPAAEVERLVADAVRRELAIEQEVTERELVEGYVARIEVQEAKILIELSEAGTDARTLRIPWQKPPFKRRRELLAPASANPQDPRPIRADARARVVAALSRGRRWLDEIVSGSAKSIEEIANALGEGREYHSARRARKSCLPWRVCGRRIGQGGRDCQQRRGRVVRIVLLSCSRLSG